MDTTQSAKDLASEVRKVLRSSVTLPGEATASTLENVWDEIENRIAAEAKRLLDDAHAAGKAEGIRESQADKCRVFDLGKEEGRREALGNV